MINLVYLFMKMHLLALLQHNCIDLVRCAFLRKLSACVRSTSTEIDTNILVKPKYWPNISVDLQQTHFLHNTS